MPGRLANGLGGHGYCSWWLATELTLLLEVGGATLGWW